MIAVEIKSTILFSPGVNSIPKCMVRMVAWFFIYNSSNSAVKFTIFCL